MNHKVSVIGTGRMGSALATALHHKGFSTTAWNRTPSKAEALARLGLRVAPSLEAAALASDVIIVNVSDYSATAASSSRCRRCFGRQDPGATKQRHSPRSQKYGILGQAA